MRKIGVHSDSNFPKAFGLWVSLDRIRTVPSFKSFAEDARISNEEKERIFKLLKIYSFSVVHEYQLATILEGEFRTFNADKVEKIRKDILGQIKKSHSLKGPNWEGDAEELLKNQTSRSDQLIVPPVLFYLAGYSMGGLIGLAQRHFKVDSKLIEKLIEFKVERDYAIHNATSSRHDADERFEKGIALGEELQDIFDEISS